MRGAALALLIALAGCGSGDNLVVGYIDIRGSDIVPFIQFDNIRSVINGRARLFDANGTATGSAEVVIISDRPGLCDRLKQHPDYFRKAPEDYIALILFYPPTNHLGYFAPGRPGDEGTDSEIIGVKQSKDPNPPNQLIRVVAPFKLLRNPTSPDAPRFIDGAYMTLGDWSEGPGGGATGVFNLLYASPPQVNVNAVFPFSGKFKADACPTLDGTLLP